MDNNGDMLAFFFPTGVVPAYLTQWRMATARIIITTSNFSGIGTGHRKKCVTTWLDGHISKIRSMGLMSGSIIGITRGHHSFSFA